MVTIVMAMSVMCVPAMAETAGVDYLTAASSIGDLNTSYTRTQFLAELEEAEHKAVLTFEDGTYEIATQANQAAGTGRNTLYGNTIRGFNVPISNCTDAELNVYWKNSVLDGTVDVATKVQTDKGATSGTTSINVWTNENVAPNRFAFGY